MNNVSRAEKILIKGLIELTNENGFIADAVNIEKQLENIIGYKDDIYDRQWIEFEINKQIKRFYERL